MPVSSRRRSASYIRLRDNPVALTASGMVTAIGVCIGFIPQGPREIGRTLQDRFYLAGEAPYRTLLAIIFGPSSLHGPLKGFNLRLSSCGLL